MYAIVQRANETLAEYQRMRSWFVWPEEDFPRSATQKPKRKVIREAAEAGLRGQELANAASPMAELLTRITGRSRPNLQNLSPEANLESGLGLSSLERVELFSALEDRYQVDLSEAEFTSVATVGDLERLLQGRAAAGVSSPVPDKPSERPTTSDQRLSASLPFHYPRWVLRWPVTWIRAASRYLLARPALFIRGWPRVIGRENLRGVRGPLLVVSNHIADVDIAFIQTALPARIRHRLATAAGGEALERLRSPGPDRAWLVRAYGRLKWTFAVALLNLFPLPRQAGFRKSFAYAGEAVDRGYSVLVFPEGKHTTDGKIAPFQSGVGLLTNNLRIPVLPMRIDGLFAVKQAGRKFAAPGEIRVLIGKPMQFAPETDPREIAGELQKAVENL